MTTVVRAIKRFKHRSHWRRHPNRFCHLVIHAILTLQIGILALLDKTGAISQISLSSCMNIDQASMVRFLNGLLKKGLIQKKSQISDGRVKLISMTKPGRQVFKKIKVLSAATEENFLKNLSSSEQKIAKKLVAKMIL